jgi:hypothetical protein
MLEVDITTARLSSLHYLAWHVLEDAKHTIVFEKL